LIHPEQATLKAIREKCKGADETFLPVYLRHRRHLAQGKFILASNRAIIRGIENIQTLDLLEVGMSNIGFVTRHDRTLLNIMGKLKINMHYLIGKGCSFVVGGGAVAEFGHGYVGPNTKFIITNGLTVGNGSAISWGCQFLDDDYHRIIKEPHAEVDRKIVIGGHVWIGCNVLVLKGAHIPDGCVVAAGSVVVSKFTKTNCLIAGNPAQVIREDIRWT